MAKFIFKVTLIGAILTGHVATAKMPDNLTCLTYQMKQAIDELNGQKPTSEEWLNRVIAIENSVLFLHKLSKDEKNKIIAYHLSTLKEDPNHLADIIRLINHLCMTKLSDTERTWLADALKRQVGLIAN